MSKSDKKHENGVGKNAFEMCEIVSGFEETEVSKLIQDKEYDRLIGKMERGELGMIDDRDDDSISGFCEKRLHAQCKWPLCKCSCHRNNTR